jgi:YggT family protein
MSIIITFINFAYYALVILIFARIILSFVNIGSYELREMVFRLTEPLLAPLRNILPPMGGLDFSPMILLIGIDLLRRFLFSVLF